MRFVKYQALGNDFIIVNRLSGSLDIPDIDIPAVCERRKGIGADGVLYLLPSENSDLKMRIFNADGSEAEICGNGVRALALFALHEKEVEGQKISVETKAGVKKVQVLDIGMSSGRMQVSMGRASFLTKDIPMQGVDAEEAVELEISCAGSNYRVTCVSMGNPHCVNFVDDLWSVNLEEQGGCLENHEYFPQRANVEFVQVLEDDVLAARVWERGVGETPACGTGACACVAAGHRTGRCSPVATVSLPGGDLLVEVSGQGEILLSGEVRRVFEGKI